MYLWLIDTSYFLSGWMDSCRDRSFFILFWRVIYFIIYHIDWLYILVSFIKSSFYSWYYYGKLQKVNIIFSLFVLSKISGKLIPSRIQMFIFTVLEQWKYYHNHIKHKRYQTKNSPHVSYRQIVHFHEYETWITEQPYKLQNDF
jgi:hypothetical protein